ncbi:hypothetical protein ACWDA3_56900 [Nonomuraea rubra]
MGGGIDALRDFLPRLAPGAVLLLDDYADLPASRAAGTPMAQPKTPGVLSACRAYFGASRVPQVIAAPGQDWGLGLHRAPGPAPAG